MDDTDLEFCKECGMEFPNGMEETCPLCGNEVDGVLERETEVPPLVVVGSRIFDADKCEICKEWCDESDLWFWDFWTDFDSPEWLSIDDVWCVECILKNFKRDNPDFEASGLEPDTYLVWKDALDSGIDLGPKLFDIEMSNAVRRLHECAVSREDIIQWLDSDCPIDEAEEWPNLFDEFDDAMVWRNAGFKIGDDDVEGWLEWGCTAAAASEFVNQGAEYAPRLDWKKFGIEISDAVYYQINNFSDSEEDGPYLFIGTWAQLGLSPSMVVKLRHELDEAEQEIQNLHDANRSRLKLGDWTFEFWGWLPKMFESLKSVGLPINVENLKKFWGLSDKEILKVIDAGGKPGVAAEVIRRGGSVSKLGIIERLLDSGVTSSSATLLAQRGFLVKHLKQLEKSRDAYSSIRWLVKLFESVSDVKVDEALGWLEVEATVSQVKLWRQKEFSPEEAAKWSNEGFQPDIAGRWRDVGVNSPVTAKRRRDAGLNP